MAFDLDDEELKATRRMNGSDKNVGSVEEDIKVVERLIEDTKKSIKENIENLSENRITNRIRAYTALEHLIKAYKELEKKEKFYTELEQNYFKQAKEITDLNNQLNKSIPISKIEEKIEELKKEADYRTIDNPTGRIHFHKEPCDYQIKVLQELLEKRK